MDILGDGLGIIPHTVGQGASALFSIGWNWMWSEKLGGMAGIKLSLLNYIY
jgi:hypothetical protein